VNRARGIERVVAPLCVVAIAGVVVFAIAAAAGFDVEVAARAAFRGAFGGSMAIVSATLKRATPLLFLGIAVAVAFRAGVLNIGAEGQFLTGAAAAVITGLQLHGAPTWLVVPCELGAGILGGACWAGIAAWLRARFRVQEVVSTLLLNIIALNVVGYLIRGPFQEPTGAYPQSALLEPSARLPLLIEGQRLHLGFVIALAIAVWCWWVFAHHAAGFRLLLTGASRSAAASAGMVAVETVEARALLVSGGIAGLAGAAESTGVTFALYEGLSPGYGYTAIAVALLAGLHPLGIIVSAVLFGALGAGADAMQRDAGVPAELAGVIAALVVLGMLALPGVSRVRDRRATQGSMRGAR
jgi:simple sugar transport system permease protein